MLRRLRILKPWLQGARFCTHCLLTLAFWTLWLGLVVLLVFQLHLLSQRELAVPDFLLRRIERELDASGLRVEIGYSAFDPAGELLLRDVKLVAHTLNDPLVTARVIFLRFDPWALAVRQVDLSEARLEGVTCYLPAMVSPSGRAEPLVRDLAASLRPGADARRLEIRHLDARIDRLLVKAAGSLHLRHSPVEDAPALPARRLLQDYLRLGRTLAAKLPELESWENPRLSLRLAPSEERIALVRAELFADGVERTVAEGDQLMARNVCVRTAFPLTGGAAATRIDLSGDDLASERLGHIQRLQLQLDGALHPATRAFTLREVGGSATGIDHPDLYTEAARARVSVLSWPAVAGEAAVLVEGAPWSLAAEGDLRRRAGTLRASGVVPHALLETVGRLAGHDLGALLAYDAPPTVRAEVDFAAGGRPVGARGRLDIGPVDVRSVPLDAAGADFSWDGNRVVCSDLLLRQGGSEARGSYEMNTATSDYRFLLTGRLRPLGIEGWFKDWWSDFWGNFDFTAAPPQADVDVAGRWRAPHLSRVFVAADAAHPRLRGVAFDRVRTRVFVRPEFYDGLDFLATQGARSARGRFTRSVDLATHTWRWMEFAVESDLELAEAGRFFGPEGAEFLEPFQFAQPPQLKLTGRLDGPASPAGEHLDVRITADSTGAFAFHQFPLSDLRFTAHVKDDVVLIEKLAVGFAGGQAKGRVELRGQDDARQLGFDLVLSDARLGEAIRTLETFSALRRGEELGAQSKFQHRLARGRLDLAVSAEGRYAEPYSFHGMGNAQIGGAELGEINLLGVLSSLLRRTLLDFTTLQLDSAYANFAVEGRKLAFSDFKLTGPRAAIDAHGDYFLDSKTMAFNAKVFPFEESSGLLGSAVGVVLTPLSNALEVKLTDRLERPSWTFVYGPMNILRTIISPGGSKDTAPADSPEAPSGSPAAPAAEPTPPLPNRQ